MGINGKNMKRKYRDDFAIGVDIEPILRFRDLDRMESRNFLAKIFTEKEIEYCYSKKEPAQQLAVRFTAKEAVIKALSYFGLSRVFFNNIEIVKDKEGRPFVHIAKEGYNNKYSIKISLSHCEDKAIAFAVVEQK